MITTLLMMRLVLGSTGIAKLMIRLSDVVLDAHIIVMMHLKMLSSWMMKLLPYAPIITDDALDAHTLMMIQRMLISCN